MADSFDIAVIGGGSGGLTVAAAAAKFGRKVVLFEKGRMGGDCLNYGCVPSKALLAAARQAQALRDAGRFGIAATEPAVDFGKVMDHVHRAIAAIAPHDSVERFTGLGVKVVAAEASFRSGSSIAAGGTTYTARRVVIATGSRAAVPPIAGLAEVPYLTNESLFGIRHLPAHLVIVGGGPMGLEMAQGFRRLGSQVTVIEAGEPLGRDDPELAGVVADALRSEGIAVLAQTAVQSVHGKPGGVAVETAGHGTIAGSHLLLAAGRVANVEGLDLAAAGVAFSAGGITVDAGMRTSNRHIYAIGDVAGGPQFTHLAAHQAEVVIRNALFGLPARASPVIPHVTFTDPELAQVGLTETAARDAYGDAVTVLRWPFGATDRGYTDLATAGLVKVIAGRRGRILGAGIAGRGAGDLIQPWVLAMSQGLKLGAVAHMLVPYPVLGEASRRTAISAYAGLASSRWVRRVIGLVSAVRR